MLTLILLLLLGGRLALAQQPAPTGETPHGVVATFSQGANQDSLVLPNLALFVQKGKTPTSLLEAGPFQAELAGSITIDLRAQYTFQALASGTLDLLINGTSVLSFTGSGELSETSKPVRLTRGTNAVLVRFTSKSLDDARFQIFWMPKNIPIAIPIPASALSFQSTRALLRASQIRTGLYLFTEYRCGACHSSDKLMEMDAPDFDSMGSRLNTPWLVQWVQKPARLRPDTHMPGLFDENDNAAVRDIAAYLGTLANPPSGSSAAKSNGEHLFKSLNCGTCHDAQNNPLDRVREKFQPGALAAYLQNPQAHYPWNPMPNFKLNADEARALAAFLDESATQPVIWDLGGSAEKGKAHVQNSGCLNCHKTNLENHFSAPPLAAIAHSGLKGCLDEHVSGRAPRFNLNTAQRAALAAFLAQNRAGLPDIPPHELALREVETLRCTACHDKLEGLPRLETFGAKLKPEWASRFIGGEVPYKPRPWLAPRMPAFPAYATTLAAGLAALHGNPPQSPPEPPADAPMAITGAKLVSAAGGFSCVACHAIGSFSSGQVVETPGVNLAYSGERLLKSFFHHWVMNPIALDVATKMPVYFDAQGRSQLTEILEGDGDKQIEAMWQYIRLGDKMPPPPTP